MKYLQKVVELPQELEEHIIYFNETDGKICVKPIFSFIINIYNITNVETSTRLTNIKPLKMIVDGETIDGSLEYQFDTVGEHTVELYYDPNITDLSSMFGWSDDIGEASRCLELVSSDLTNFKCSKATSANHMYAHARNMVNIKGLSIAFRNNIIEDWGWFLNECSGITSILDVSYLVNENAVNCQDIMSWISCTNLIGFETWNMSNVENTNFMFYQCPNIEELKFPESLNSLGGNCCRYCKSLKNITLPNILTKINQQCFQNCVKLETVNIPDSVLLISNHVFRGCTSLTSVTIPNSVTSIGDYVFYLCSNLTSITYNGTTEQWNAITKGNGWKDNVPSTCIVHCTDGDINIADV